MKLLFWLNLILFSACFSACNMEKEIDLNLPEFKSEITLECYLEAGQPYRATVSESTSYFDRPEPVLIPDATVIITHNGKADTLIFQPTFDKLTGKFYTHTSKTIVSGNPGESYAIQAFDTRGRKVTGTTTFLAQVQIDSIEYKFDENNKALLLTSFKDNAETEDFYRFQIFKDTLNEENREYNFVSSDRLRNGTRIQYGTTYKFSREDTVFVNLYHIEKQYYDFLSSLDDAQDANGNPFAQPIALKSSVQGGVGIFTTLVYDRKRMILK
jgi:hypothetical protein